MNAAPLTITRFLMGAKALGGPHAFTDSISTGYARLNAGSRSVYELVAIQRHFAISVSPSAVIVTLPSSTLMNHRSVGQEWGWHKSIVHKQFKNPSFMCTVFFEKTLRRIRFIKVRCGLHCSGTSSSIIISCADFDFGTLVLVR